jgi:hypothetical protein
MNLQTINIQWLDTPTGDGHIEQEADVVSAHFAVHPMPYKGPRPFDATIGFWTVTHLKTGSAIGKMLTIEDAYELVAEAEKAPFDWDTIDRTNSRQVARPFVDRIKARLCDARGIAHKYAERADQAEEAKTDGA